MKTSAMIKHEIQARTRKLISFIIALGLVTLLISCDGDDDLGADKEDSETAQLDALEDFYQEDSEDLALELMDATELEGGKTAGDDRLACATVTRTGDKNSGSLTIDFGAGCTDPRGNVRRGRIIIEFEGRYRHPGSFWRLRFENYFINDVAVQGTREVTNTSESEEGTQVHTIVLEDGTMTWPDGSIARRRLHRTREIERDQNNVLNRLIIYGTAEGNHRNGRGYTIDILEPLVYSRACAAEGVIIPVSGVKLIKHGERQITVDYGDGACDNIVTITNKNGRAWDYDLGQ
jgi:hypothetical protein